MHVQSNNINKIIIAVNTIIIFAVIAITFEHVVIVITICVNLIINKIIITNIM